jgi:gas vesicle protein
MDESKGLAYFFLGLGVGVAVGMLFAPQSGAETRGLIRSKAGEGGEYIRRRSEELRDQAGEMMERGKEVVGKQREQLSAAIDAGKQAYREAVSSAAEPRRPAPGGAEAL